MEDQITENAEKNGAPVEGAAGTDAGTSGGATEQQGAAAADAGFTDTADETEAPKDAPAGTEPKADHKTERNARAARERREREAQAKIEAAKAEADTRAVIEALDGKNPFTGAEMKDAEDVKAYRTMKAIKARGGDPTLDYAAEVAEQARREAQAAKETAEAGEKAREELSAFAKKYPDVKVEELLADPDFTDYAEGKVGRKSLSEIYDGYVRLTGKAQNAAEDRAAQKLANAQSGSAAAGSVTAGGAPEPVTQAQFARMDYNARMKIYNENPELYKRLAGR